MKDPNCPRRDECRKDSCPKKKIGVLLFDMQEVFLKKVRPKGEADRIKNNQLVILEYCREFGIPVFVLTIRKDLHGPIIDDIMYEATCNAQCFPIDRESNDGFRGTVLDSHLKSLGIKRLFFMGLYDYACIKHTAETAINLEYEIITSDEVIAKPYYREWEDNVAGWFESKGSCIGTVQEFLEII